MKTRTIKPGLLLIMILITCVACHKDPPPEDPPDDGTTLNIVQEIAINKDVYTCDGNAPFIFTEGEGYTFAYTTVDEGVSHLVKYSLDGNLQLDKVIGSSGQMISGLIAAESGGYYVSLRQSSGTLTRIMKLNESGDSLWSKSLVLDSPICSIKNGDAGCCLFSGVFNKRGFIQVISSNGDSLERHTISDTLPCFAEAPVFIPLTPTSWLSAYNYSDSLNHHLVHLSGLNGVLEIQWQYDLTNERLCSGQRLSNGNLLFVSAEARSKILVLGETGQQIISMSSSLCGGVAAACQRSNNDYLLACTGMLCSFNESGQEQWSQWYRGDFQSSGFSCRYITEESDGHYVLWGYKMSVSGTQVSVMILGIND